jgi:hypothetical protein
MSAQTPDGWSDLVHEIERRLSNLSPLGPRLDAKMFERAEKLLFDGRRLVAATKGQQIHWRPYQNLSTEMVKLLLSTEDGFYLTVRLKELYRTISNSSYDLEQVHSRDGGFRLIEPSWVRDMQSDQDRINTLIANARVQAMEEGRVIVIGEGAQLFSPASARLVKTHQKKQFILSWDLPKTELLSAGQKRLRAKDLSEAMKMIFMHFQAQGRRVTKEQLFEIGQTEYQVSRTAAEEAYDGINKDLPTKSGPRLPEEKVSMSEIKQLILKGGGELRPPQSSALTPSGIKKAS